MELLLDAYGSGIHTELYFLLLDDGHENQEKVDTLKKESTDSFSISESNRVIQEIDPSVYRVDLLNFLPGASEKSNEKSRVYLVFILVF